MQPETGFPPLTVTQTQLLRQGIDLFNREMFFECHEALEEAWLQAAAEQKRFLQGLIQAAVCLHHLRRGNLSGAGRLLSAGLEKLSAFVPRHESVEVGSLLASLEPLRAAISAGKLPEDWQSPRILLSDGRD